MIILPLMATEIQLSGTDIPNEPSPSSVGALVWPPIEATEQRKKRGIDKGSRNSR